MSGTEATDEGYLVSTPGRRSTPLAVASIGGSALAVVGCVLLAVYEWRDPDRHLPTFVAFCLLSGWFVATLAHGIWRATLPAGSPGEDVPRHTTIPTEAVDRCIADAAHEIGAIKCLRREHPGLSLVDAKRLVEERWPAVSGPDALGAATTRSSARRSPDRSS